MEENKVPHIKRQIDFVEIFKYCLGFKRIYVKVGIVAIVFSAIYVYSLPRFYSTEVKLAPEESTGSGGALSSLASLANIKIGGSSSGEDAIYPELYPELFRSKSFLVSLFDIQVHTKDNTVPVSLYDYLTTMQKIPFWQYPIIYVRNGISNLFKKEASPSASSGQKGVNPFRLSLIEDAIAQAIGASINCSVDKHTNVITLVTTAQDPVVSALFADSIMNRLQDFIIQYRTNKARVDVAYSEKLLVEAKSNYERARQKYADYADSHEELYLASYKTEETNLENEMQLAYNVYSQVAQQLQISKAKVQEKTPVFTTIESATVPLLPAGPKRMRTIVMFFAMSMLAVTAYLYFRRERELSRQPHKGDDASCSDRPLPSESEKTGIGND
ncbi:MAG TPA: chain-length determining protein [Prevotellaceae bacterium]|nr:chain-length determining protein [Prevotellaceae bacterium]